MPKTMEIQVRLKNKQKKNKKKTVELFFFNHN